MAREETLATLYATADPAAVARLAGTAWPIGGVTRCEMLRRGFNDTYEIEAGDRARYVLRLGTLRARGATNVAYETALLAHLKAGGVPVAAAIRAKDGGLWTMAAMPEGERAAVLFPFVPGREADRSPQDAAAHGVTLAMMHEAALTYDGPESLYRLDLGHLLHRPLEAFFALPTLDPADRPFFEGLAARLDREVSVREPGLSIVACHGDCHGSNARIEGEGLGPRRATFFDFDDGGPGFLAYDLAVFAWSRSLDSSTADKPPAWPAFLGGYRSVRPIPSADLDAIPLFVAIRHFWLLGEYARRYPQLGKESLPDSWAKRQADFLRRWDETKLSGDRLL